MGTDRIDSRWIDAGYRGWTTLRIWDSDLVLQGTVRWVRAKGWEAECMDCDSVIASGRQKASAAVFELERHVEATHGGDNPGAGR